jgi:hypothetical protein
MPRCLQATSMIWVLDWVDKKIEWRGMIVNKVNGKVIQGLIFFWWWVAVVIWYDRTIFYIFHNSRLFHISYEVIILCYF